MQRSVCAHDGPRNGTPSTDPTGFSIPLFLRLVYRDIGWERADSLTLLLFYPFFSDAAQRAGGMFLRIVAFFFRLGCIGRALLSYPPHFPSFSFYVPFSDSYTLFVVFVAPDVPQFTITLRLPSFVLWLLILLFPLSFVLFTRLRAEGVRNESLFFSSRVLFRLLLLFI